MSCSKNKSGAYGRNGMDEREARKSVQTLTAGIKAADKLPTRIQRHHAVDVVIREFRDSPYGKVASRLLNETGKVLVPLFSVDNVADKTKYMLSQVKQRLLVKNDGGELIVSEKVLKNERRIKSELRFMVNPGKLGGGFVSGANEMAETMSCVLLALAFGSYEGCEVESMNVLLNSGNVSRQMLHKDQKAEDIEAKMTGGIGGGSRSRPQPPPFSALCAFQEGTNLHCIDGSHLTPLQTRFSMDQANEYEIPTGSAFLFHAVLVHAGMNSTGPYHSRLHMYLKATGCCAAYSGKIQVVADEAV